jgi:hypothetical protein
MKMGLTRSQAVRIAAIYNGWLDNHQFAQEGAWGSIFIKYHNMLPDVVMTFFALGKDGKDVTGDVLARLSAARNLTLVLPLGSISPKTISTISSIEKSWRGKSKKVDKSVPANAMREYFRITLIEKVVDDQSDGKQKYYIHEFNNLNHLAAVIKQDIIEQPGETKQLSPLKSPANVEDDLKKFLSLSKSEMQFAVRTYLFQKTKPDSYLEVNMVAQESKKKRCFEDLENAEKLEVKKKAQKLVCTGMGQNEIKYKIMDIFRLARTIGLEEMISYMAVKAGHVSTLNKARLPVYGVHLKDLTEDQRKAIRNSMIEFSEFDLTKEEINSKIVARHGISDSEITLEFIDYLLH